MDRKQNREKGFELGKRCSPSSEVECQSGESGGGMKLENSKIPSWKSVSLRLSQPARRSDRPASKGKRGEGTEKIG